MGGSVRVGALGCLTALGDSGGDDKEDELRRRACSSLHAAREKSGVDDGH